MIKGPALICLNFHMNTARRYIRHTNVAVAGLGWELVWTHKAKIDPKGELDLAAVERFRATGA